jgi:hypothetical protein
VPGFSNFPKHLSSLPDIEARGKRAFFILQKAADVIHAIAFEWPLISASQPTIRAAYRFVPGKGIRKKKLGLFFLHDPVGLGKMQAGF